MTDTAAPARATWKDWVAVAALLITMATVLLTGGRLMGRIDENTRRIEVLEHGAAKRDDDVSELKVRIAGMDAKLDLLINRTSPGR